jgi:large subunit ribosomal protein L25
LEQLELKVTVRKSTGNGPARVLRRAGEIPAVLYGRRTEPMSLSVNIRELENLTRQGNVNQLLFNILIENGKTQTKKVMIKELQTHPVTRDFLHVDFYEIDMQRKVTVGIPIVTTGKSVGVERGGILQIVRREIEVLCLPDNIPSEIVIDITDLDIGDSVHVEEIPLASDVELEDTDVNFTILTVVAPRVEAEPEPEEEEEEGAEVEGEEGAEEEDSEPEE